MAKMGLSLRGSAIRGWGAMILSEAARMPAARIATANIAADAVREMRVKQGQNVAAIVKSTEVMIVWL
ncbi:MAG: hypothetical protein WB630_13200 [Candidatus Acidiferrales bacterium]